METDRIKLETVARSQLTIIFIFTLFVLSHEILLQINLSMLVTKRACEEIVYVFEKNGGFHFKNSSPREKIDWTCGEAFPLPGKHIYCTHSRLKWT